MIKMLTHPEALRRLAGLIGLLAAICLYLWPVEYVNRVNLEDFAAQQRQARWKHDRAMALPDYIAKKTEDRLRQVRGPQWEELFRIIIQAAGGREAPRLQGRKYQISPRHRAYYYFSPGEQPMASLAVGSDSFNYLTMVLDGRRYYLGLNRQPARWAGHAPAGMLYPGRAYAWIPLALGILAYLFIPRRRRPEGAEGYGRLSAQVLPDIVGLLIAGGFFALPLLIVFENASPDDLLDVFGGWGIMTLIFWVPLAGCGVALLAMAARYAAGWIKVGPEEFTWGSLRGQHRIAYADIKQVRPYQRRAPRWLKWGLLFFGGGNPTATGQAIMLDSQVAHGLEFELADGRRLRLATDSLPGADALVKALKKAGVAFGKPVS